MELARTPDEYVSRLDNNRQEIIQKIRTTLKENLPKGYVEEISYGMIGYVIPFSLYPAGYAVKPKVPLPLINLASQKNHIAIYHTAIYAIPDLYNWFVEEYPKHCRTKIDMGKGCIRFKKPDDVPYQLIGELAKKVTVEQWIDIYDNQIRRK